MKRIRSLTTSFAAAVSLICALASPSLANSRVTIYSQEVPASPKTNIGVRFQRVADGTLMRTLMASYASSGTYANLTVAPVTGLYVNVAPPSSGTGAVYQLLADDTSAWGGGPYNSGLALASDSTQIMLQGILSAATANIGPLSVPGTSGQSQIALIECGISIVDTTSQSANFTYDANGDQASQTVNRDRVDSLTCQSKEGTAASSPTVPTVDSGYVAIAYVTVPYGTSTITTGMVTAEPALSYVNSVTAGSNVVVGGTASAPTVATTAAPSFSNVTDSALTSGNCVQATTGGLLTSSLAGCGSLTGISASSPLSSTGGTNPTVSLSGVVPIANGGTNTAAPTGVAAGSGISVSGSFPSQTVAISAPVSIANGGTGSTSQNFVDLTTGQTIGGAKTFTGVVSTTGTAANFYSTTTNANTGGGYINLNSTGTGGASFNVGAGDASFDGTSLYFYDVNNGKTTLVIGANNSGSTFSGPLSATSLTDTGLTTGLCVQTSTGGLFTNISYKCGIDGVASITANVATSSTSEVQVIGTTIPANAMNVGTLYHIKAFGQATVSTAGATITFRIRIGSASLSGTVIQSLADTSVVGTAISFVEDAYVTVRTTGSSGTAIGRIQQTNSGTTGISANANLFAPANGTAPTTATVNTTQSNVVELTMQTSATTSTPTIDTAEIEIVKP